MRRIGVCAACYVTHPMTKDGVLYRHGDRPAHEPDRKLCPGSGKPPWEPPADLDQRLQATSRSRRR